MNNLAMWGFWSTSRAVKELPNNLTGVVLDARQRSRLSVLLYSGIPANSQLVTVMLARLGQM